jgi:hypothetical protein
MAITAASAAPVLKRRRLLSSSFTFLMKYLFPAFWMVAFGFATLASLVDDAYRGENGVPDLAFCAIWLVGSIVLVICSRAIKRVETDDSDLYISNFLQEIKVPLSNVIAVSENRWISQRPVTIRFRSPTRFGPSVVFIPVSLWFGFWSAHPVVAELRRLAGIEHAEAVPLVPLSPAATRIPGSRWTAAKLAGWDKANPGTFLKVNLTFGLLAAISNGLAVVSGSRGLPPMLVEVARDVVLPICGMLVLSGLYGLAQPDARRAVLRLHGALLLAAAMLLVFWMAQITLDGIARHTGFGWSPGLTELSVSYAVFLFTRFTLREDAHRSPLIFYLPALVVIPVMVLDIGVISRFIQMVFFTPFTDL